MPFCKNCGSPVEGSFCAKCGTPQAAVPPPAGAAYTPPPPQAPSAQTYSQAGSAYTPPPGQAYPTSGQPYPPPGQAYPPPVAADIEDNVAGMLCYVPFVGWIAAIFMLVAAPYNQKKFIRFCAFQSIFMTVTWFAIWIAVSVVVTMIHMVVGYWVGGFVGLLIGLLHLAVWLGFLALCLFMAMKAYQNQKMSLPIIGPLADKQA